MKTYAAVALFLLVPAFAISQSTTDAAPPASDDAALVAPVPLDQQPSKEDMSKLFEVMHLREQVQKQLQTMPQIVQQQMQQQWMQLSAKSGVKLTRDQQAGLNKLMEKYMTKAMNVYSVDDMFADMIPIFRRHFTKEDVSTLTAFYSLPAEQHLLALQPILMQECFPLMMKRFEDGSNQLNAELATDLKAYMESIAPAPKPAAK